MKIVFLLLGFILLTLATNAQSLNDTTFYFKDDMITSSIDSADLCMELKKISDNTYTVNYLQKEDNHSWKLFISEKYTIQKNGNIVEETYHKKKLISSKAYSVKKEGKLYHFSDDNGESYSHLPIPIIKDSLSITYYPGKRSKLMECAIDDKGWKTCTFFDLQGNIIEKDVLLGCDEPPTYDGKDLDYFREVVQREMVYPPEAVENGIFGRVIIQFIIRNDGSMGEVIVLRGVAKVLDDECVRAIKATRPLWVPGLNKGKPANVVMVMPLIFMLK